MGVVHLSVFICNLECMHEASRGLTLLSSQVSSAAPRPTCGGTRRLRSRPLPIVGAIHAISLLLFVVVVIRVVAIASASPVRATAVSVAISIPSCVSATAADVLPRRRPRCVRVPISIAGVRIGVLRQSPHRIRRRRRIDGGRAVAIAMLFLLSEQITRGRAVGRRLRIVAAGQRGGRVGLSEWRQMVRWGRK